MNSYRCDLYTSYFLVSGRIDHWVLRHFEIIKSEFVFDRLLDALERSKLKVRFRHDPLENRHKVVCLSRIPPVFYRKEYRTYDILESGTLSRLLQIEIEFKDWSTL
mgnify:CR=1 FL=1